MARKDVDTWKLIARGYFTEHVHLIEQSAKPALFFSALASALPADLSPQSASRLSTQLESFLTSMIARDRGQSLGRGIKAMIALRTRLATAANPPPTPEQNAMAAVCADAFARSFLNDTGSSQEALSWLKAGENRHTLGELASTAVSVRMVNAFYKAGAVKVWAVSIDRYPNGQENSGKLVLELPEENTPRQEVLRLASRKSSAMGFGNIDDVGQHYVFLMLD